MGRVNFAPTASLCRVWSLAAGAADGTAVVLPAHPISARSLPCRIFPVQRYTRSFQACGRVSGLGLLGGACTDALRWVCKQRAATVQWLQSSPPAFLWGNTTYSCVRP